MYLNLPYGVPFAFTAPIPKVNDTDFALSADWTPATGDVKVSKDGGNVADITTLPTAVGGTGSALWRWSLSAAERQAQETVIQIIDAAVEHQAFVIRSREALSSGQLSSQAGAGAGEVYVPDAAITANDQFISSIYLEYSSTGVLVGYGVITDSVEDTQDKLVLNGGTALWWTPTSGNYFTIERFGVQGLTETQVSTAVAAKVLEYLGAHRTTIGTLASQTSFTLTAGSADNDAYNDWIIIVIDATTAVQKAVGYVRDYDGATKGITLALNPGIFTMAVGDIAVLLPPATAQMTGVKGNPFTAAVKPYDTTA